MEKLLNDNNSIPKTTSTDAVSLPVSRAANFFEVSMLKKRSKNQATADAPPDSNAYIIISSDDNVIERLISRPVEKTGINAAVALNQR